MSKHVREQQPEVGKFAPFITGHSADQGTFTMHHLIVRKRQHKVFGKRIQDAESDLILMP